MHDDTQYIKSANLKSRIKQKPIIYGLMSTIDKPRAWFCGTCRRFTDVKYDNTMDKAECPVCHSKAQGNDTVYKTYADDDNPKMIQQYGIDCVVDGLTINKTMSQNQLIAVNATILYRDYRFDDVKLKQTSYSYYVRYQYNFETRQMYKTTKYLSSSKVKFHHMSVNGLCVFDTKSITSYVNKDIIQWIYDYYHLDMPAVLKKKHILSYALAGYCLKFPVVMYYGLPVWMVYNKKNKDVDCQLRSIYWACHVDRPLRAIMLETDLDKYKTAVYDIFKLWDIDQNTVDSCYLDKPISVVYARFMYQLGFRDRCSLHDVVNYVMSDNVYKNINLFVIDMLHQRTHMHKKFWKRVLQSHDESDVVIQMVGPSTNHIDYEDYFDCLLQMNSHDMFRFHAYVNENIKTYDFDRSLDEMFDTWWNAMSSGFPKY